MWGGVGGVIAAAAAYVPFIKVRRVSDFGCQLQIFVLECSFVERCFEGFVVL